VISAALVALGVYQDVARGESVGKVADNAARNVASADDVEALLHPAKKCGDKKLDAWSDGMLQRYYGSFNHGDPVDTDPD